MNRHDDDMTFFKLQVGGKATCYNIARENFFPPSYKRLISLPSLFIKDHLLQNIGHAFLKNFGTCYRRNYFLIVDI